MNSGGFEAVGYRLAAVGLAALLAVTNAAGEEPSADELETVMKIRITVGGTAVTATLADNATARDFASLLPLTLTLEDYASTEKIGYPPRKLTDEGAGPPA